MARVKYTENVKACVRVPSTRYAQQMAAAGTEQVGRVFNEESDW